MSNVNGSLGSRGQREDDLDLWEGHKDGSASINFLALSLFIIFLVDQVGFVQALALILMRL
jgi:hypothetical protein